MRDIFGTKVGLSDHTLGLGVSVAATVMGATVLEKHVTLRRADGGVDSAFSMEPDEVRQLIESCRDAATSLGSASQWTTSAETESLRLRPSLYVTRDVLAGEIVSSENVRSVRPAGGLPPKEIDKVMGRTFSSALPKGTPVDWPILS
jgi:N-acetylneuraminate synthase